MEDLKSPVSNNADSQDTEAQNESSVAANEKPFRLWSTLGIQSSVSSTPLALGAYLSLVIGVGGSPTFFYGYMLSAIMSIFICASLSEIAAVFPHSSGQIYWTAVLTPPKYSRGLSYLVGWLTNAAWFLAAAVTFLFTAQMILALVEVFQTQYIALPWHTYMVYIGVGLVAFTINVPLFMIYPYLLNGLVPFLNGGALFIMIALLVTAHPKQSASFVFTEFVNATGWKSDGTVFFLGLLPGVASVIGFDGAAHMTNELPNPRQQVPKIMILGSAINILAGLPMIIVYEFCIVNAENLLAPVGGQPIIQLFVDTYQSDALIIISGLILIICFAFGAISIITVFSRSWASFAHEKGVPFSSFMSKNNERLGLPLNSICFCVFVCIAIGAIQLGSTLALNAFGGALVMCFYASYSIPIICLLVNRRRSFPQKRYFSLGKFGPVINVVAVSWMLMMMVWLCFPTYIPIDAASMNYAVVVFAGMIAICGINWVVGSRKHYVVPLERIEGL